MSENKPKNTKMVLNETEIVTTTRSNKDTDSLFEAINLSKSTNKNGTGEYQFFKSIEMWGEPQYLDLIGEAGETIHDIKDLDRIMMNKINSRKEVTNPLEIWKQKSFKDNN